MAFGGLTRRDDEVAHRFAAGFGDRPRVHLERHRLDLVELDAAVRVGFALPPAAEGVVAFGTLQIRHHLDRRRAVVARHADADLAESEQAHVDPLLARRRLERADDAARVTLRRELEVATLAEPQWPDLEGAVLTLAER